MDEEFWKTVSGGEALTAYFGHRPIFHDGEIIQLCLNRRSASTLTVHIWGIENIGPVKHAVVTLTLTDIIDLELENFSQQNVIGDLTVRRLAENPEREPYYDRKKHETDVEIELVPCYGLNGFIRAGSVEVTFTAGKPADSTY